MNQCPYHANFILEKLYWLAFRQDKRNCPLYTGVRRVGFHCNRVDSNIALPRVLVIYNNDNNGHIISGAPNDNVWKMSVRKTI